jgi:hypothetical protein
MKISEYREKLIEDVESLNTEFSKKVLHYFDLEKAFILETLHGSVSQNWAEGKIDLRCLPSIQQQANGWRPKYE